jgi:hypothetical protein
MLTKVAPWILLVLTLIGGVISLQLLGLLNYTSRFPRILYSALLGSRGNRFHDRSTPKQRDEFIQRWQTRLAFFFIVGTIFFANQTYRAFLN